MSEPRSGREKRGSGQKAITATERPNIMNDDNNRPLAERQAHLYALRTQLPVGDVAHAQAAAWHRVKDAAGTIFLPDTAVLDTAEFASSRAPSGLLVRFN